MITEIGLVLALLFVLMGSGMIVVWSIKPSSTTKTSVCLPAEKDQGIEKLEKDVFAKADKVIKIVEDTQEIQFPKIEVQGSSCDETAMMKSVSDKVSTIRKRAGI
ncbi:MAG: hypothetical protein U0236_21260 [Nitrospira sp.]